MNIPKLVMLWNYFLWEFRYKWVKQGKAKTRFVNYLCYKKILRKLKICFYQRFFLLWIHSGLWCFVLESFSFQSANFWSKISLLLLIFFTLLFYSYFPIWFFISIFIFLFSISLFSLFLSLSICLFLASSLFSYSFFLYFSYLLVLSITLSSTNSFFFLFSLSPNLSLLSTKLASSFGFSYEFKALDCPRCKSKFRAQSSQNCITFVSLYHGFLCGILFRDLTINSKRK